MAKATRSFPVRLENFPVTSTRDPTWDPELFLPFGYNLMALIFYYYDTTILNWGYFRFLFFPSPCFRMLATAFPAFLQINLKA